MQGGGVGARVPRGRLTWKWCAPRVARYSGPRRGWRAGRARAQSSGRLGNSASSGSNSGLSINWWTTSSTTAPETTPESASCRTSGTGSGPPCSATAEPGGFDLTPEEALREFFRKGINGSEHVPAVPSMAHDALEGLRARGPELADRLLAAQADPALVDLIRGWIRRCERAAAAGLARRPAPRVRANGSAPPLSTSDRRADGQVGHASRLHDDHLHRGPRPGARAPPGVGALLRPPQPQLLVRRPALRAGGTQEGSGDLRLVPVHGRPGGRGFRARRRAASGA